MKRILFLVLLVFIAGVGFISCSRGAQGDMVAPLESRRYTSLPFANDNSTRVSMLVPLMTNVTRYEYDENSYTRELVRSTGVQFDFISVSASDLDTRRNLLLSSGDYPDVLNGGFSFGAMSYYANQGILIPLDDYHYLDYPNIAKAFNDYPALNTVLRMNDGKVYALPYVDDAIWSTYQFGRTWIYMPWVRDHHQMQFPKTLDELTSYLRWIRDTDVNGNGRNDEVPIVFHNVFSSTAYFAKSFMPFVLGQDHGFGLAIMNGVVTEQYRADEFREAIKYMEFLYREGLMRVDAYTMTEDQVSALSLNPEPVLGIFVDDFSHGIVGSTNIRWVDWFVLPPMDGPAGRHWATNWEPWGGTRAAWHVTDKARDPELIIALYDYMANLEMYLNGNDQKNISWADPDPGALGLNSLPAMYKRLAQEQHMHNSLWYVRNAQINSLERRMGEQAEGMDIMNRWLTTGDLSVREATHRNPSFLLGGLIHWSLRDVHNAIPADHFIQPRVLSDNDNQRIASVRALLEPYLQQSIAEFVTGVRDINNDAAWNSYLSDLDRLGAKERADILQKYQ